MTRFPLRGAGAVLTSLERVTVPLMHTRRPMRSVRMLRIRSMRGML